MPATKHHVTVRMYNVGFGDAFVVTVSKGRQRWRMLVDCGVHPQGQARSLDEAVRAIIADLAAESPDAVARVDVLVATHHHADHIAGFALDAWEQVAVDEVWVPFVEDPDDDDAKTLRKRQVEVPRRLVGLLEQRTRGLDPGRWPAVIAMARWFAANSSRNEVATERLLGRNGHGFATKPRIRYLPSKDPAGNVIATTVTGVNVHVLGPSRDPAQLKRMDPPARAGWLALDSDLDLGEGPQEPLFNPRLFVMGDAERVAYPQLTEGHQALRHLDQINDSGLLAAAAILERSVNNTSVFMVLNVADNHLLFPGDAQQGAWDHVLADPESLALVSELAFYKISHHGSHNGTPKPYVEDILRDGAYAMLPWHLVKRWQDTIPKAELLDALRAHNHHLTRADNPIAEPRKVTVHGDLWSEVTFSFP